MIEMSLREEIDNILHSYISERNTDRCNDEILSTIEKRIDSILKEEPHNTIDYAEGFARGLMKVKELLK